jgi:hypothetical protein
VQPDYVHAKHMYNIQSIKNRKLKFGLGIGGLVTLGCAVPWVSGGKDLDCTMRGVCGEKIVHAASQTFQLFIPRSDSHPR